MTNMTAVEIDSELAKIWVEGNDRKVALNETTRRINRYKKTGMKVPEYLTALQAAQATAVAEVEAAAAPFEAEYDRRHGWNRFFVVPDGHVHRNHCSTLRPTTVRNWLPQDSGSDSDIIVKKYGERACTVCFCNAPVAR